MAGDSEAAPDGDAIPQLTAARRVGRGVLAVAGVLVVYYALPVGDIPSRWGLVLASCGLLAGLAALVYVAVRQLRTMAARPPGDASVRLDVLVLLLIVVVPLFALGYYGVEQASGGEFDDLETKTDALYFTLSTLATVGFGDVHAAGQLARTLVSVQIVFDVVFVATLVSLLTSELRARAVSRRSDAPD
jgi:voltage-gated potassium channel